MPTEVVVRPALESDDVIGLAADDPFADVYQLWKRFDNDELSAEWCVACVGDRPVGVAAVVPAGIGPDGSGPALLTVRREHRRRGVGSALREYVEGSVNSQLPAVVYRIVEGESDSEAAVTAWDLVRGPSHSESVLDLTAMDRGRFEEKAVLPGVDVATLEPFDSLTDADWRALHDFVAARNRETPDSEGATADVPYPVFRAMVEEPWMMCVAHVGDQLVGITMVTSLPGGDAVNTMLTGVVPSARGRGVASALKCAQALVLADHGVRRIVTQNMAGNEPILAANRTMGFVHHRTEVELRVPLG